MNADDTTDPRFKEGDLIAVKTGPVEQHCRTPTYLRGAHGRIVEVVGQYKNPSELAFHRSGLPALWLYRVIFEQNQIWPKYCGSNRDAVVADLYEHWLLPVKEKH